MHEPFWIPSSPIGDSSDYQVRCTHDGVQFEDGSRKFGVWKDWLDGNTETTFQGIPPLSGQMLLLDGSWIEEQCNATRKRFCWLCRLAVYYRENDYAHFKSSISHRLFGSTTILQPKL